jgi:hypothetical protein
VTGPDDEQKRRMAEEIFAMQGGSATRPGGITAEELRELWGRQGNEEISDHTAARWLKKAVRAGEYTVSLELRDGRWRNVFRKVGKSDGTEALNGVRN